MSPLLTPEVIVDMLHAMNNCDQGTIEAFARAAICISADNVVNLNDSLGSPLATPDANDVKGHADDFVQFAVGDFCRAVRRAMADTPFTVNTVDRSISIVSFNP